MDDVTLRSTTPADLPRLAELNRDAVPAVGELDDGALARLVEAATVAPVAEVGGHVVAFLIGLGPGVDYGSPNYRFFTARYPELLYVDRVVVDPAHQRRGIGAALYDHAGANAGGAAVMAAEVNVAPPNPESLAFHAARGFVAVGEQEPYGDGVRVRMFVRELVGDG